MKRCFGRDEKVIDCDWDFIKTLRTLQEPREQMPRLKDLLEYLASPGVEDIWLLLDIKLDNDAESIMQLIAETIASVNPSKPWEQRIVLGCWAVRIPSLRPSTHGGNVLIKSSGEILTPMHHLPPQLSCYAYRLQHIIC